MQKGRCGNKIAEGFMLQKGNYGHIFVAERKLQKYLCCGKFIAEGFMPIECI